MQRRIPGALRTWYVLVTSLLVLRRSPLALGSINLHPAQQDTSLSPPWILAFIVSGSERGDADGIYSCVGPTLPCVHLRKPQLRLHQEALAETAHSRGEIQHHTRRTIFSGADLVYEETWKQNSEDFAAGAGEDVPWVWVHSAAEPTRHAPSLRIAPVRDTGCAQDAPETAINWQEGKGGDTNANEAIILGDEQLGDVYHQTGRFFQAAACYGSALRKSGHSRQRQCTIRLALCTVNAATQAHKAKKSIGGGGGGGGHGRLAFSSGQQTEEVGCLSALLLPQEEKEEETPCVSMIGDNIVAQAHVTVGEFRMCEEWDIGRALYHFSAAARDRRVQILLVERQADRDGGEPVPDGGVSEWGAVWLAQAIQGRSDEASIGFAANATVFGEAWAGAQLQTWRRGLSRRCSGLGMASVIEGAERLILAGARAVAGGTSGVNRDRDGLTFVQAEIVEHQLALSRALLLQGAFEEAGGHARAAERLVSVTAPTQADKNGEKHAFGDGSGGGGGGEGSGNEHSSPSHPVSTKSATAALLLEILLLSRTPVVLETEESAPSLREELMVELERLQNRAAGFGGSIPSPLDVGVRAHFLATYQGLDDKALASALARVFDHASGGTLSYYPPYLLAKNTLDVDAGFGDDDETETPPWCANKAAHIPLRPTGLLPTEKATHHTADPQSSKEQGVAGGATAPTLDDVKNDRVVTTRVGFLSAHIRWHSVGRLTVALLEELSASRALEVFVIDASVERRSGAVGQPGPASRNASYGNSDETSIMERLSAAGASVVRLAAMEMGTSKVSSESSDASRRLLGSTAKPTKTQDISGAGNHRLHTARETVAALKLDVLVYGDVGMDAFTTALAHGRLSPIQVAFWGHPGTTGLPTMDYFVTSDLFEQGLGPGGRNSRARRCDDGYSVAGTPHHLGHEEHTRSTTYKADNAGGTEACAGSNVNNRQDAFSEQLVRLGGLGFLFDDPVRTFRWDPQGEDTNDQVEKDAVFRETPSCVRESMIDAKETGQDHKDLERSSGGRIEHAPPPPQRSATAAASPQTPSVKREQAVDANRPRLYVCAQSLMKMHPSFDTVLAGILAADPLAQVVLLRDSRQLLWHSRFRRRLRAVVDAVEQRSTSGFDATAAASSTATPSSSVNRNGTSAGASPPPPSRQLPGEFWSRVRFVSPLSGRDFFGLQCRADVVLDPFPFGGGVTTLEALACGTPVVTAGALQTVHRLAEGMIAAIVATPVCQDGVEHSRQQHVDEAGSSPTKESRGKNTNTSSPQVLYRQQAGRQNVGKARSDGADDYSNNVCATTAGRHTNNACTQQCCGDGDVGARTECQEGDVELEVVRTARTGDTAVVNTNDGNVLVANLVAETASEYIGKAVAVAAPGALKERVRRALRCGRDGVLQGGGGNVVKDWESFLKRIAASANTDAFLRVRSGAATVTS